MASILSRPQNVNKMRPEENGQLFIYDIFKCILLNLKFYILIQISLKFIPDGPFATTVKCRYNAVFGVQEIDRVIAVTAL